jgi:hypothetical protein
MLLDTPVLPENPIRAPLHPSAQSWQDVQTANK